MRPVDGISARGAVTGGALVLIVLTALVIGALGLQAAKMPLVTADEPLWYQRSQRPVWLTSEATDYYWAKDVPSMCRVVYGAALDAADLDGLPNAMPDYNVSRQDNAAKGTFAPADAVLTMRACNVAAFVAGLIALYFVSRRALGRPYLALLPLTPFLFSPTFPVEIVPRVGPDAFLFMFLALHLAVWTYLHLKGRATTPMAILVMGVAAGLATTTKINGALAAVAYCAYLAIYSKGKERAILPLVGALLPFAVFYFANPAFIGRSPVTVVHDILQRRVTMMGWYAVHAGPMSFTKIFSESLPAWPVVPLLLVPLWLSRRAAWFAPAALWGATLAVGTILMIDRPVPRYLGPLEMGLFFPAALAAAQVALWIVAERRKKAAGEAADA